MGKNLRQQRRGQARPRYIAPSHRYIGAIKYPAFAKAAQGKVIELVHSTGKKTPVAVVDFAGRHELMIPADGTFVGQTIAYGETVSPGNVVELGKIPEGMRVFNIELQPGDGGKLCRSPGSAALVVTRGTNTCVVELPSKRHVTLSADCRATIGVPAGAGRGEKPFMKAGNKYYAMRATNRLWPHVRGVAMNPVDHPFGGKTKPGMSVTVSRFKPPGAKVGSISPRRTGKKKA
ncbi:MAG: 50S ribosomal protein L2 [Candidatus Aenigmatarchaeota archaeon]